jgi:hypothetical protein
MTRAFTPAYARDFQAAGLKMRETVLNAAEEPRVPTLDEITQSIRPRASGRDGFQWSPQGQIS